MSEDNTPLADAKVPFPDAAYATRTTNRLTTALIPGSGLGKLATAVSWAGRVQGTDSPKAFTRVAGLVVDGNHRGDYAAGEDAQGQDRARHVELLSQLAQRANVPLEYVETEDAAAAEVESAMDEATYLAALEHGKTVADRCIDSGVDLIVLCGIGAGTSSAAIAVGSHLTRTPLVEMSPRLLRPGGFIDDNTWMRRTAAIRDTFARLNGPQRNAKTTLSEFGGPVIATLTAIIVSAAVRRTPMLIDGPVAAAAALVARDFSLGAPKWCYAPDRAPHPVVDKATKQIGMAEPLGFGVDLGDGCGALNSLPILQDSLQLVEALPFPTQTEPSTEDPGEASGAADTDTPSEQPPAETAEPSQDDSPSDS